MMHVILQNSGSAESRAVRMASMVSDDIRVSNATLESLSDLQIDLKSGSIPVGSVEFVRLAMELIGMQEPENMSYPVGSDPYMKRKVWLSTTGYELSRTGRRFIKPVATKSFTGFVLDSDAIGIGLNDHDEIQYKALCSLAADTRVWVSEPVNWVCEYRYYVMNSTVIGKGRYDQEESDSVEEPDFTVVEQCIDDLGIGHPYALDMGVLASGETALVELNDAWAVGLYRGAMKSYDYVRFLAARWKSLTSLLDKSNHTPLSV